MFRRASHEYVEGSSCLHAAERGRQPHPIVASVASYIDANRSRFALSSGFAPVADRRSLSEIGADRDEVALHFSRHLTEADIEALTPALEKASKHAHPLNAAPGQATNRKVSDNGALVQRAA